MEPDYSMKPPMTHVYDRRVQASSCMPSFSLMCHFLLLSYLLLMLHPLLMHCLLQSRHLLQLSHLLPLSPLPLGILLMILPLSSFSFLNTVIVPIGLLIGTLPPVLPLLFFLSQFFYRDDILHQEW